jgi:glycosyltransferase involved in cell wall biosynthesis
MRLAFIHPFLYRYPRGIERFLYHLANALARLGVEVDILTWRWPKPVVIDRLAEGVRVRVLPTAPYYSARCIIPWYVYYLVKEDYDFVWIFFAGYGEAESLSLASVFRDFRYGVSLHYPYSQVPHRYREFRRFRCLRRARRVVAVSQFVADGVRRAFGLSSRIIRTGVDVLQFRRLPEDKDRARRALGLPADDAVVLTVAALEERKGIQHVLASLQGVRRRHPRLRYLVVGEGPYRPQLERQVAQLGLADVVRLVGATTDVLTYYQAADVFVLLSRGEAAPIAPLEAMAVGLPLVLARQRPFDEIVGDDCGVMVPENDPAEVARMIGTYLSDPCQGRAAGEAGRRRVSHNNAWGKIAQQYLECSC